MINEVLGENIRRYRLGLNWTQEKLAEVLHVSHQIISRWENGLATPDIGTLCSLTNIFNVSLDSLCGLIPNKIDEAVKDIDCMALIKTGCLSETERELVDNYLLLFPTEDKVLFVILKLLRARHDRVETDTDKENINSLILTVSERILDFSSDDTYRSFANYNLALYYSEQVNLRRGNEQDKRYAEKAMQYANLVLYKDMHKTFYHSLGATSAEEDCDAKEKTLTELMDSTKRACKNLINCYRVYFPNDDQKSENLQTAEKFLLGYEKLLHELKF